MTAATLPYQDHFWKGLRINPSFDEVLESTKKKSGMNFPTGLRSGLPLLFIAVL
jgi:hypothetical protein